MKTVPLDFPRDIVDVVAAVAKGRRLVDLLLFVFKKKYIIRKC